MTVGPDLTFNGGICDAFVAKVKAAGTALVYCGYIGGSGVDRGTRHRGGRRGQRLRHRPHRSNEASFPVTVGPDLTYNGGSAMPSWRRSRRPARRSSTAATSAAMAVTIGLGIAVDGAGNAYVTGHTASNEASFPVTAGPT